MITVWGSVGAEPFDVVEQWAVRIAVGGFQHGERDRDRAVLPFSAQSAGLVVLDVEGQRGQGVGSDGPGQGQRAQRGLVQPGDQHQGVDPAGQGDRRVVGVRG